MSIQDRLQGRALFGTDFSYVDYIGYPAACRGHITDLPAQAGRVSPVESRSIPPQGGESVALPFGRPLGSNPVVAIT